MTVIDRVSRKIADKLISAHQKERSKEKCKIEGIKDDIFFLKELQQKLQDREKELELEKVEWERTFDSILDNIVIIDSDGTIRKTNKSFDNCYHEETGMVDSVIGRNIFEITKRMGVEASACPVHKCIENNEYQESMVYFNFKNRVYHVIANPIINPDGELVSVVRISRDITKIHEQNRKLQRRSRLFRAVSEMSKVLVDHENFEPAIQIVLKELSSAVGANRSYIFKNEHINNKLHAVLESEWHEDDISPIKKGSVASIYSYDDNIPIWKDNMECGQSICGDAASCLIGCVIPCEDKHKVKSLCVVPIYIKKNWWGFIGFDDCSADREWTHEEETILRIAADIIGGVLYHRRRYFECLDKIENC